MVIPRHRYHEHEYIVLDNQKRRQKMSKRKLKQLEIKKIMKEGLNKNE
ncbi:MAG: hypothetical protein Q8783_02395 [Candidatus Phytoplasma stylosanthis]|nr:hypothetical protein [Candidatus Phytoplasma stylosanthis]